MDAFNAAHIELIAFFDGTLKENKKHHTERVETRQKTISVLKHIRMIGTPPPKIWWIPPSGLRTCLRNALRSLNVIVVCKFLSTFIQPHRMRTLNIPIIRSIHFIGSNCI